MAERLAVVTGVSRGLGLAIARRLVDEGWSVLGLGRRPGEGFEALETELGPRARFRTLDLADAGSVEAMGRAIAREEPALEALVNNAGLGLDGVLATMHRTDIERLIATNLTGPILLTKYLMRPMLARRRGTIVHIGSIIGSTGFHGLSVYGATKAGLEGFTRSLAREAGKRGVTVNLLAPGYMETDMTAGLAGDKLDAVRRRAPLGLPSVERVAGAVAFLLSDDARAMTGSVLTVDGGSTA